MCGPPENKTAAREGSRRRSETNASTSNINGAHFVARHGRFVDGRATVFRDRSRWHEHPKKTQH